MQGVEDIVGASRFWKMAFCGLLFVGIVLHLTTLTYSPLPWIDEVQIIEIGQGGIGAKTSGWSMCSLGNPAFDKQAWAPYYLGGWFSELFYQALGHSGPRLFSLIGLMLATLLFYRYASHRLGAQFLATVFGVIFFSFPSLVQSVRGARVDVWAFVCLWFSLNLLFEAGSDKRCRQYIRYGLAGTFAVTACFFWASAVLFGPVYIWAFFENFERPIKNWKSWIGPIAAVMSFVFITAALLLMPFYGRIGVTIELASWVTSFNSNSATFENVLDAAKGFALTVIGFPYVFFLGILGIAMSRKCWWLKFGVVMFCVICVFVAARIYVFRMLYFSAYAFVGLLLLADFLKGHLRIRKALFAAFVLIAIASFLRSVILRNGIEFLARDGRDFHKICAVLENGIGRDAVVYSDSYQIYYAARALGWRQHRLETMQYSGTNMLSKIKYVVLDPWSAVSEEFVKAKGFDGKKILTVPYKKPTGLAAKILSKTHRTLSAGPFVIYSRHGD